MDSRPESTVTRLLFKSLSTEQLLVLLTLMVLELRDRLIELTDLIAKDGTDPVHAVHQCRTIQSMIEDPLLRSSGQWAADIVAVDVGMLRVKLVFTKTTGVILSLARRDHGAD